jgi:hypothetical protein
LILPGAMQAPCGRDIVNRLKPLMIFMIIKSVTVSCG